MGIAVKNKIRLGTLFLFILLLIMGGVAIYVTTTFKKDAKTVIKDNYESLSYCHAMMENLDSALLQSPKAISVFEQQLTHQEENETEPGEKHVTAELRASFDKIKSGDTSSVNKIIIQQHLQKILTLNMLAIFSKNQKAEKTAANGTTLIIALAAIIFIIAFTFSVNFPSIVAEPISELTQAISAIANKDYKHRVHITNRDEFGKLANAFNNMAERLEYFENSNLNKLMFEKSRAEAVINSLKDASIGIDKNDIVLFANSQALQLLGMNSIEMVGKNVGELSTKNDLFRFLVNDSSTSTFKVIIANKENYFVKELIDVAQGDSKVIVLRNITTFKELDVAKTNFIATISHELKTPLAASDFSLKLLEDERIGNLSTEQKELVQNLKYDNQRILKIVSELLNMSQVETGKIHLDLQPTDPNTVLDNALATIANSAKEKNIVITKIVGEYLPMIKADADKTTWVLNNLLTNAIKHSEQNSTISLELSKMEGKIIFSVLDNGPGIGREHLSQVFERYFQVPGTRSKGSGLGLAISKEFIEAQGGQIWVKSEVGKGAKFSFSLPVT